MSLPTPYYEEDGIVIYHADCRDILPHLPRVDLVLTDPPYGIDGGTGRINLARGKGNYTDAFEDTPAYIESIVIPAIKVCIDLAYGVVVSTGIRNMHLYPRCDSFGCLYQPAASGMQIFGNADASPIFYYGRNPTKHNLGKKLSHLLIESDRDTDHPCPKPLKLWTTILHNCSLPGQTILDPFLGSGTTLVAAQSLGRKAIGIEIEKRYCDIAIERLRQQTLPLCT